MDDITSSRSIDLPDLPVVKQENYKFLCSGCLSQNREVAQLVENIDLFDYLAGTQHDKDREILLCWECQAILRKIHIFQKRVQYAQKVLKQAVCLDEAISCLSTLGTCKQNDLSTATENNRKRKQKKAPECEINEKKTKEDSFQVENPTVGVGKDNTKLAQDDVEIVLDEKLLAIKEEIRNESNDVTDFDNDNLNYETDNEIKKELICIEKTKLTNVETKPKKKKVNNTKLFGITEYKDKVKITKSDIDINNFDQYFEKVILTEEIIEKAGKVIGEDKMAKFKSRKVCRPCHKAFQNNLEFQEHITFCHVLKEEGEKANYTCIRCRNRCEGKTGLRSHWRQEHCATMRCRLCGYRTQFNKKEAQAIHTRTHQYLWTCKLCTGVVFDLQKDFLHHYKSLHKFCYCHDCGHRFRRKSKLVMHIAVCHSSLFCTECGIQYGSARSFGSHMRSRHPTRLAPLVPPPPRDISYCVECDKQFAAPDLYRRHLYSSIVHNPNYKRRKNVPCPECGKVFTRPVYMKRHFDLFHAKKTKFHCEVCGKYLSSNFGLRKHIMGVHHKVREPRNKICDICGRAFQTNAILRHHRRTHTGERPHACPHCRAAFAQKYALHTHMRTQHKAHT